MHACALAFRSRPGGKVSKEEWMRIAQVRRGVAQNVMVVVMVVVVRLLLLGGIGGVGGQSLVASM
jgi:hypothetical protein